jgi:hypothetical protein
MNECPYCHATGVGTWADFEGPTCGAEDLETELHYTREAGHDGNHVACGYTEDTHPLHEWRKEITEQITK